MKMKDVLPYWTDKGLWFMFFCSIIIIALVGYGITAMFNLDINTLFASIIGGLLSGIIIVIFGSFFVKGFGAKSVMDQANLEYTIKRHIESQEFKIAVKEAVETVLDGKILKEYKV